MATKSERTASTQGANGGLTVSHIDHPSPPKDSQRRSSALGQLPHAEHGPLIDHNILQADVVEAYPDLLWSRIRHTCRDAFSEFLGTFILLMFGDGVVAQVVLSSDKNGNYQSISRGWGYAYMTIYVPDKILISGSASV